METTENTQTTQTTQQAQTTARGPRRTASDNEIEELMILIRQACRSSYANYQMFRNVLNGNSYNLRSGALRTQISETLQARHLLAVIGDFDRSLSIFQRQAVNSGDLERLRQKNQVEEQCLALTQQLEDLTIDIALQAQVDADRILDTRLAKRLKERKEAMKAGNKPQEKAPTTL